MLRRLEIQARNFGVWRRLGRSKHIGYNHHRRMERYMGDRQHAGRLRRNHALAAIVTLIGRVAGMEPQHFMLCSSCVAADMQSANCRPNKATSATKMSSFLLIALFRL